jgi:hypothetical protein
MEFWMKLGQQNMNYWTQMEEFYRHSGGVKPNENKPK